MKTDRKIITIPDFLIALKAMNVEHKITLSDIHLDTRITYGHLHYIKKMFITKGWITFNISGSSHFLYITEKGKRIINAFDLLLKELDISKDDISQYRLKMKKNIIKKEDEEKKEVTKEDIDRNFGLVKDDKPLDMPLHDLNGDLKSKVYKMKEEEKDDNNNEGVQLGDVTPVGEPSRDV